MTSLAWKYVLFETASKISTSDLKSGKTALYSGTETVGKLVSAGMHVKPAVARDILN